MVEYDTRTDEALTSRLHTPISRCTDPGCSACEALAEREFLRCNVLSGTEDAMRDQPTPSLRHGRGITPDDGDGDDDRPLACKRMRFQGIVTSCVDTGIQSGLQKLL